MTSDETVNSEQGGPRAAADTTDGNENEQSSSDRDRRDRGSDASPDPQTDPDSPGATIDDPEPAEPNEPG